MRAARVLPTVVVVLSLAMMSAPARAQGEVDPTGGNAPCPLPAGNLQLAASPVTGLELSGIGTLRERLVLAAYLWLAPRPAALPDRVREQPADRRSSKRRR